MPSIISKVCGSTESVCKGSSIDTIHFTLLALCPTMGKVLGEVLKMHQGSNPASYLIQEAYQHLEYRQMGNCTECGMEI